MPKTQTPTTKPAVMSPDEMRKGRGHAASAETAAMARQAVKVFRQMNPGLTAFARMLTGNNKMNVLPTQQGAFTDGKNIYVQVPIELGRSRRHDRQRCEQRDSFTGVQMCRACAAREDVLITLYHEIAHNAFDSFASMDDKERITILKRVLDERRIPEGTDRASKIARALEQIDPDSYAQAAMLISPFLHGVVNVLEDVRVNIAMYKARPGTLAMFKAQVHRVFTEGIDDGTGEMVEWRDMPVNAQAIVACYAKAARYDIDGWFAPEIEEMLEDEELTRLLYQTFSLRSVGAVYELAIPVLERIRELGYCRAPDDAEDDPEPEPEPTPEPESSDDDDLEQDDPEPNEDDDDGDADPENDDDQGDRPGGDEADDSDGPEQDPTPEQDGADDDDTAEQGDDDDAAEQGDDDGPTAEQDDDGPTAEQDDGPTAPEQGDDGPTAPEQDDDGPEQDDGPTAPEQGEQDDDGGDDGPEQDPTPEQGDDTPSDESDDFDADGEPSDDDDSEPSDDAGDGTDADDQADHPDDEGDGTPDENDGDDEPGDGTAEHDADGGDQPGPAESGQAPDGESDPLDDDGDAEGDGQDGAEQGEGDDGGDADGSEQEAGAGTPSENGDAQGSQAGEGEPSGPEQSVPDLERDGDAELVEKALRVFGGHAQDDDKPAQQEADEDEPPVDEDEAEYEVGRALVQGQHFEAPSINVYGVRVHEYDKADHVEYIQYGNTRILVDWSAAGSALGGAWYWDREPVNSYDRDVRDIVDDYGVTMDDTVPEALIAGPLMEMRRTFEENRRAKHQRNLKSGSAINGRSLGRRVATGDPRIFSKKKLPGKKSYFVLIGLDCSGSQAGENMRATKMAALCQAELCHRAGIPFAMYAHTANGYRGLSLDIYVIKAENEAWDSRTRQRLYDLGPSGGNLDGHTLEFYRKRAEESRATDRIIMYFTDGAMPAANYEEELEILQRELKICDQRSITIMGVGIGTDSPSDHGLDTVQVDGLEDMPAVVKHLGKKIIDPSIRAN